LFFIYPSLILVRVLDFAWRLLSSRV